MNMKKVILIMIKIFNKLKYYFLLFIFSCLVMPILFFIKIIDPIIRVRMQIIDTSRIGAMILDPVIYQIKLREGVYESHKHIDIFCFKKDVANLHLKQMLKKKFIIFPYWFLTPIIIVIKEFQNFFNLNKNLVYMRNFKQDHLHLIKKQ